VVLIQQVKILSGQLTVHPEENLGEDWPFLKPIYKHSDLLTA